MPLDDGKQKSFDAWLDEPDIEDMFRIPYPTGTEGLPPNRDSDPGRARHAQFFNKVYGDCLKAEVERNLVDVVWLPKKAGQKLKFSSVNGAAENLAAVSRELDKLPARYNSFLFPSAGTYNCRVIAGTDRTSAHGHGIAIDLALPRAHYWRWTKADPSGNLKYQNAFPMRIVSIFETHGFIWGGKWYHYDTMHFEYRPELLAMKPSSKPDQPIGRSRTKRRNPVESFQFRNHDGDGYFIISLHVSISKGRYQRAQMPLINAPGV